MLEEVRITGLGVIDDAVLELSPGFTVVTGETGAGKTMVVTGLGLLFGGRADPARVRPGAQRAIVEGRLQIDPDGEVARQVDEAGGELDDNGAALVISRSVSAEGRSRAHAGGRSVPVSLLTYLADDLVAVHGQADQQQLLRAGRQREALDTYAGAELAQVRTDYQRAYGRHRDARAELAELTQMARERTAEAEDLRRALEEIEALDPVAGEDAQLLAEEERLGNAEALRAAAAAAHEALLGDPSAVAYDRPDAITLVGGARQELEAVRRHDPALAGLADRLNEASYLLADVAGELASYTGSLDADPARLAAVQERRAALARLVRAYGSRAAAETPARQQAGPGKPGGPDAPAEPHDPGYPGETGEPREIDGVGGLSVTGGPRGAQGAGGTAGAAGAGLPDLATILAWTKIAAARLNELEGDDERIAGLAQEEAELAARVAELAGTLTALRHDAALRFSRDVTAELTALAMPHARLTVAIRPLDEPGPHGADDVEIRLAAHPGAPPLPLTKGASGGELSRVMLAIEVVFAGADPVPTFVFDEVDAGVGGKAAVEIGRRLARLARLAQVIVVTHLPQVAAFADNHLVVTKAGDGLVTSSGVVRLDQPGRVRELSRMLAGLEDSEFGRAHAEELLTMAASERVS
jgi:DNA repair protein RecN (Recombination protein N)